MDLSTAILAVILIAIERSAAPRKVHTSVISITPAATFPPCSVIAPTATNSFRILSVTAISLVSGPCGAIAIATSRTSYSRSHGVPFRRHLLDAREPLPRRLSSSLSLGSLRDASLPFDPLLLARTLALRTLLLNARRLPHRLASPLLTGWTLLSLLLRLLTLHHHLLTTSFLLLPHLLNLLASIRPLLALGLLLPLPAAHLLLPLGLTLLNGSFLTLHLPTTPSLLLTLLGGSFLALLPWLLLSLRRTRWPLCRLLALRLFTLYPRLAATAISAAIPTAVTSTPALAKKVAVRSEQRNEPERGHR